MKDVSKIGMQFPSAPPKPTPMPNPELGKRPDPHTYGIWGSHDPAIFHDPKSGNYYTYCSSSPIRRSPDLLNWEYVDNAFPNGIPQQAIDWTGGDHVWAPDMIKVGDEYRLYCSNSTWGVRGSCIFLATADTPEGPFTFKDFLVKTTEPESPVNAIDPNPIIEEETGDHYMVYGSFWGGIRILKLDKETGLVAPGQDLGKPIAVRPEWAGRAIEGPYVKYNPETGYYYLFVSYASLKEDYNIRVGRSKCITGPYLDHNGRDLADDSDEDNTIGYLLACGYRFDGSQGWMGPGHNSVLHDFDGKWYLVTHIRPYDFKNPVVSTMHIHQILWTSDGWPVASPCRYAGETAQPVKTEWLVGDYERIQLVPLTPQGVLNSVRFELLADGRARMANVRAHWELTGENTLAVTFGKRREEFRVLPGWDWENWEPTIALTGKDDRGIAVWAKKIDFPHPEIK